MSAAPAIVAPAMSAQPLVAAAIGAPTVVASARGASISVDAAGPPIVAGAVTVAPRAALRDAAIPGSPTLPVARDARDARITEIDLDLDPDLDPTNPRALE